jgi:hypothetical protein
VGPLSSPAPASFLKKMLRTMTIAAPAIAAFMVVVLLFEPPALHPSERIPTLRVLTGLVDSRRALDADEIADALALGRRSQPPTYALATVTGPGVNDPGNQPSGVLYTPFLQVAWAAHARQAAGRSLGVDEIPSWMAAPVAYVAIRAPSPALADIVGPLSIALVPADTPTCCHSPQPSRVPALWVSDDLTALARFGAPAPFEGAGLVAAYPLEALQPGLDLVVFRRVDRPTGPASVEVRVRLDANLLDKWR